jgi:YesN/AraC family two-component response regulator
MGEKPRPSILIIDGDVWSRAALAVFLEPSFLIETVATASDGLHRLSASSPDLVILDVDLPDLDGPCLVEALRVRLPVCPVIVIAAPERTESLRELTALGIESFFQKPFHIERLLERIRDLLPTGTESPVGATRFNRHVCKAIEYLGHNSPPIPSVAGLAEAIGISSSHLGHLFRSEVNMTVRQYLAQVRVEVTKRTLLETRENLERISEAVGFSDASHLSRVFRKYVGRRPGAYRRRPHAA